MKIAKGLLVELEYRLLDEEGTTVESSEVEGPMIYVQGEGHVPPGLELHLEGAEVGDELEVTLAAGEAFGEYDPEGILSVPRGDFPPDAELTVDEWIEIEVQAEEGDDEHECGTMQARVVEFDDESVVLDTNLPLAGHRITFDLVVLDVRQPTAEDLEEIAEQTA